MKIEEAIAILENSGWWGVFIPITTIEGRSDEDKLHQAIDMAISVLRSMPETTKSGWISVKERLPSIRDDGIAECYLVSDGDLIHMAYYVTGEWRFCESGQITEPMFYEVTHWMPLPEPPEEE